ncbi:hypothetical protein BLNAU_17249 [Blattamonas nauphoetae]|uniref:B30.2/SPRY domain-containing protein n=1 Tax=Blattamonas nauphoetae TaxID=2049346 RepID=A0ABQ9XAE2_9EUKA|nr:hypothetical protein BLNAU_17249 [Blattamonas nauphoetae]
MTKQHNTNKSSNHVISSGTLSPFETVKIGYHIDDTLMEKATFLLEEIASKYDPDADEYTFHLVPDKDDSVNSFVESIVILASSRFEKIVKSTLTLVTEFLPFWSLHVRVQVLQAGLIPRLVTALNQQAYAFTENNISFFMLDVITSSLWLSTLTRIGDLASKPPSEQLFVHETVFKHVLLPLTQYFWTLFRIQHNLNINHHQMFKRLLTLTIRVSPSHEPTMMFSLSLPVTTMLMISLANRDSDRICEDMISLSIINDEWISAGGEIRRNGERLNRALKSDGFDDFLEQIMKNDEHGESWIRELSCSQLATIATFSHFDVQCSFPSSPPRLAAPHSPTISDTRWKASPTLSLRMSRTARMKRSLTNETDTDISDSSLHPLHCFPSGFKGTLHVPTQLMALPQLLFTDSAHFTIDCTTITRSAVGLPSKAYYCTSSIVLGDPVTKGIVSVTLTILSFPTVGYHVGAVRIGLLESTAAVPKLGEILGDNVKGSLWCNTPSTQHARRNAYCHSKLNEGDCVRMEVDMDSNPRTVQFFVNGESGRCFVSGLPPSRHGQRSVRLLVDRPTAFFCDRALFGNKNALIH